VIDRDARYSHRLPYRFLRVTFRRQQNDPRPLTITYRYRLGTQSLAQFPLFIRIQLDPFPGHDLFPVITMTEVYPEPDRL
jgi:hypothetical protein